MFGKSRTTLALAVAAAGFIGMSATMASAAVTPGGGDFGGLVNVSHNQVPIQLCNDTVPVNVLGLQVPVQGLAAALGLASPGDTVSQTNSSCHQHSNEADNNGRVGTTGWSSYRDQAAPAALSSYDNGSAGCSSCSWGAGHMGGPTAVVKDGAAGGDTGGLVNISDNQVPVQACSIQVPVNVLGAQIPLQNVAGGLGLLSPGNTNAQQDSSCHAGTGQANNNG